MTQTFNVRGMTCGHCDRAVAAAIAALDSQARVHIERNDGLSVVRVDSAQLSRQQITAAIVEEGYSVE